MAQNEITTVLGQLKRLKVHLQLPKFEVDFSEQLNQILIDLGMYDAFSPNYADLELNRQ